MSAELAAEVVERELGRPPERGVRRVGPDADRRGVDRPGPPRRRRRPGDRATSGPSPSRCSTPASATPSRPTCANTDLLGTLLRQGFGGLDPDEMVAEIKERVTEELDYRREAANQPRFADFYRGHPFIHVPDVAAVAVDGARC